MSILLGPTLFLCVDLFKYGFRLIVGGGGDGGGGGRQTGVANQWCHKSNRLHALGRRCASRYIAGKGRTLGKQVIREQTSAFESYALILLSTMVLPAGRRIDAAMEFADIRSTYDSRLNRACWDICI